MAARFCYQCGRPLQENAKFCSGCGTPVLKLPDPQPEEVPVVEAVKPVEKTVVAPTKKVFTLDSLDEPLVEVKPSVVFSLDALEEMQEEQPEQPEAEAAPEAEEEASVEPAPVAEPVEQPKEEPQTKTKETKKRGWPKRGGGRTFLAVLLCLLIFVLSFACLTQGNLYLAVYGDANINVANVLRDGMGLSASLTAEVLELLQLCLSWWVIAIAGVVLFVFILLLGLVNKSVLRTFGDLGITLAVASAIWALGGLFVYLMPDFWELAFENLPAILCAAGGAVLLTGLIPSAIAFGAGILLVIIKAIGKAILTKSAKSQA